MHSSYCGGEILRAQTGRAAASGDQEARHVPGCRSSWHTPQRNSDARTQGQGTTMTCKNGASKRKVVLLNLPSHALTPAGNSHPSFYGATCSSNYCTNKSKRIRSSGDQPSFASGPRPGTRSLCRQARPYFPILRALCLAVIGFLCRPHSLSVDVSWS